MTTIISRLYSDEATASAVLAELKSKGFPDRITDMIAGGDDVQGRIEAAGVAKASAAAYAEHVEKGAALVVCRAPVTPFGAARMAMSVVDATPRVDAGVENENVFISEVATGPSGSSARSIMGNHPLFMTPAPGTRPRPHGTVSESFGFRLLSEHRNSRSAIPGGAFMSKSFWPAPLITTTERHKSVMPGAPFMSKSFWPAPLVSTGKRALSVRKGGGTPFSDMLGLPLLSR